MLIKNACELRMLQFEIFGVPIPQKRPRATRRGEFIKVYDAQGTEKTKIKWQIKSLYREEPLACPLFVDITYFLPIAKSITKRNRAEMLANIQPHTKKPDVDNMIKWSFDCLNDIVFEDDSQIVEVRARKRYSTEPRTVIRIYKMEEIKDEIHS